MPGDSSNAERLGPPPNGDPTAGSKQAPPKGCRGTNPGARASAKGEGIGACCGDAANGEQLDGCRVAEENGVDWQPFVEKLVAR